MDQSTSGEGHGGGLYAAALRPLLFRLDPERAHELALALLSRIAPAMGHPPGPPDGDGRLEQQLFGLRFPNPIGLAAGFDKRPGPRRPGRPWASGSRRSARSPRSRSPATPARASTAWPRTAR